MKEMIVKNRAGMIWVWFAQDFNNPPPPPPYPTLCRQGWRLRFWTERKETAPKVRMIFDAVDVDILRTGARFGSEIIRSSSPIQAVDGIGVVCLARSWTVVVAGFVAVVTQGTY